MNYSFIIIIYANEIFKFIFNTTVFILMCTLYLYTKSRLQQSPATHPMSYLCTGYIFESLLIVKDCRGGVPASKPLHKIIIIQTKETWKE